MSDNRHSDDFHSSCRWSQVEKPATKGYLGALHNRARASTARRYVELWEHYRLGQSTSPILLEGRGKDWSLDTTAFHRSPYSLLFFHRNLSSTQVEPEGSQQRISCSLCPGFRGAIIPENSRNGANKTESWNRGIVVLSRHTTRSDSDHHSAHRAQLSSGEASSSDESASQQWVLSTTVVVAVTVAITTLFLNFTKIVFVAMGTVMVAMDPIKTQNRSFLKITTLLDQKPFT